MVLGAVFFWWGERCQFKGGRWRYLWSQSRITGGIPPVNWDGLLDILKLHSCLVLHFNLPATCKTAFSFQKLCQWRSRDVIHDEPFTQNPEKEWFCPAESPGERHFARWLPWNYRSDGWYMCGKRSRQEGCDQPLCSILSWKTETRQRTCGVQRREWNGKSGTGQVGDRQLENIKETSDLTRIPMRKCSPPPPPPEWSLGLFASLPSPDYAKIFHGLHHTKDIFFCSTGSRQREALGQWFGYFPSTPLTFKIMCLLFVLVPV